VRRTSAGPLEIMQFLPFIDAISHTKPLLSPGRHICVRSWCENSCSPSRRDAAVQSRPSTRSRGVSRRIAMYLISINQGPRIARCHGYNDRARASDLKS